MRPHSHEEVRALSYHPNLFRHLANLALSVALIAPASPAWAWGDVGHKIICQIALQELNDKARSEVSRLIALDATFDTFPDACTWPDHPRKRPEEHFVNVARSVHTITGSECSPGVPKCLFTAIASDLEVLRTSNDDAAKLASLKFLGHWVGDIHQPLHVSFADDRGGNHIRASGPCVNSLQRCGMLASSRRSRGTICRPSPGTSSTGYPRVTGRPGWRSRSRGGQTSPFRSHAGSRCNTVSALERNVSMTKEGRRSPQASKRRWSRLMPRTSSCTCLLCGT